MTNTAYPVLCGGTFLTRILQLRKPTASHLLFDGLDEIAAGRTERFELEVEALTDKYSKNIFVLPSRPFKHFVSFERFSLFKLMPFNPQQATFLKTYVRTCAGGTLKAVAAISRTVLFRSTSVCCFSPNRNTSL
ncbi:hypothetical protein LQZ18_10975 [Lachnospiraceae bacterium ZAX-1]